MSGRFRLLLLGNSILVRARLRFLLLAGVSLVACMVIALLIASSVLEGRIVRELSTTIAGKEDLMEAVLMRSRESTALLAKNIGFVPGNRSAALRAAFEEIKRENPSLLGMAIFTPQGENVTGVGEEMQAPTERSGTAIIPVFDPTGWTAFVVSSPLKPGNGTLAVLYDAGPLLEKLLDASAIGTTARVLLAENRSGRVTLLNYAHESGEKLLELQTLEEEREAASPPAFALLGEEGIRRASDERGRTVFAATRRMDGLGWGLVVEVERAEVFEGLRTLTLSLLSAGVLLFVLAWFLASLLARGLTGPLLNLSERVEHLGPEHWAFRRAVKTGDEVEALEGKIAAMAKRLQGGYAFLMEEVEARTRELKAQYEFDRAVLTSIHHGVLVVDREGIVTNANPAAAKMLLFRDSHDLHGKNITEVLNLQHHRRPVKPEHHPVLRCLSDRKAFRPKPDEQISIRRTNETLLPIMLLASPLVAGRRLMGAIAVFHDVTEERQLDYMKSEFISLASHQLRTPLSAMTWYVELLESDEVEKLSPIQKSYVTEMDIATKRMSQLIDALLHASRLEGGGIEAQVQETDVSALVAESAENMRSLAKERRVSMQIDVPKKLMVSTDPTLLQISLHNILSNAVKYSREGSEVDVQLRRQSGSAVIVIRDRGVGIPRDEQKRIFSRLFRAGNVRAMDTTGSGLGLYITKMIIDRLHGKVSFTSKEGSGTTFTIAIPIRVRRTRNERA